MGYSAEVLDDRHATILVCEDEESIRQILRAQLRARAYYYCEATTGNEVLRALPVLRPDAILLDLGLPDMDGIEVIKRIRLSTRTPIMVLSVRAGTAEKIAALDAEADDYLSKPWQAADLDERIRSMLFRTSFHGAIFQACDLVVDLNRRTVQIGKKEIQITATEYDLLNVLVLNAGRLLTQGRLTHELWGDMQDDESLRLLRTTIGTLREKLEPKFRVFPPHRSRTRRGISPTDRAIAFLDTVLILLAVDSNQRETNRRSNADGK